MKRKKRRARFGAGLGLASVAGLVAWLCTGAAFAPAQTGPSTVDTRGSSPVDSSAHVALGVPVDGTPEDDVLLDRGAYVLSYSVARRAANWVAWELQAGDLGSVGRSAEFAPDELLPPGVPRVTKHDYAGSGFDRGHLCPSGDRTRDRDANGRTFLMTNVHPQVHELNAGPWERLERFERELARQPESRLFIVAGGVFDLTPRTIGPGIAVPRASFKAIVKLRAGQGPLDVTPDTPVIAVSMPNVPSVAALPWTSYVTTVDAIEAETGYDLFRRIPDATEAIVEARTHRALP